MKRKTNLFYLSGPDSKFITFSNYTEALTGNFLSTDTKLFPDKFLCLKIGNLNSTTKANFIKYLVRYYENKLAALRDYCVNNDIKEEYNILPLSYLIDAILNVCDADSVNGFRLRQNLTINQMTASTYKQTNDIHKLITYIGNVTEQDYNGTYTDIICTINANDYKEGTIKYKSDISKNFKSNLELHASIEDYPDNLYGWENDTIFEDYGNLQPLYDMGNEYDFNTDKYGIYLTDPTDGKTIEFNVIIPLFSITNMNYNTNTNILRNESDINGEYIPLTNYSINDDNTDTLNGNLMARINVPLGMWIYADELKDSFIELKRDNQLNLYPSWSLLVASQFKPFPYSLKYRKENDITNSTGNAYATFAETLSKMNNVLDTFNKLNINIQQLSNRIDSLEKNISEIGTVKNISQIEQNLLDLHTDVKNEIRDFKKELYGYVDNITWSSKYDKNNN